MLQRDFIRNVAMKMAAVYWIPVAVKTWDRVAGLEPNPLRGRVPFPQIAIITFVRSPQIVFSAMAMHTYYIHVKPTFAATDGAKGTFPFQRILTARVTL